MEKSGTFTYISEINFTGEITVGETIAVIAFTNPVTFPLNFIESIAYCVTPPVNEVNLTILLNGNSIGNILFFPGQNFGSFDVTSNTFVNIGDVISFVVAEADATISDLSFTLNGIIYIAPIAFTLLPNPVDYSSMIDIGGNVYPQNTALQIGLSETNDNFPTVWTDVTTIGNSWSGQISSGTNIGMNFVWAQFTSDPTISKIGIINANPELLIITTQTNAYIGDQIYFGISSNPISLISNPSLVVVNYNNVATTLPELSDGHWSIITVAGFDEGDFNGSTFAEITTGVPATSAGTYNLYVAVDIGLILSQSQPMNLVEPDPTIPFIDSAVGSTDITIDSSTDVNGNTVLTMPRVAVDATDGSFAMQITLQQFYGTAPNIYLTPYNPYRLSSEPTSNYIVPSYMTNVEFDSASRVRSSHFKDIVSSGPGDTLSASQNAPTVPGGYMFSYWDMFNNGYGGTTGGYGNNSSFFYFAEIMHVQGPQGTGPTVSVINTQPNVYQGDMIVVQLTSTSPWTELDIEYAESINSAAPATFDSQWVTGYNAFFNTNNTAAQGVSEALNSPPLYGIFKMQTVSVVQSFLSTSTTGNSSNNPFDPSGYLNNLPSIGNYIVALIICFGDFTDGNGNPLPITPSDGWVQVGIPVYQTNPASFSSIFYYQVLTRQTDGNYTPFSITPSQLVSGSSVALYELNGIGSTFSFDQIDTGYLANTETLTQGNGAASTQFSVQLGLASNDVPIAQTYDLPVFDTTWISTGGSPESNDGVMEFGASAGYRLITQGTSLDPKLTAEYPGNINYISINFSATSAGISNLYTRASGYIYDNFETPITVAAPLILTTITAANVSINVQDPEFVSYQGNTDVFDLGCSYLPKINLDQTGGWSFWGKYEYSLLSAFAYGFVLSATGYFTTSIPTAEPVSDPTAFSYPMIYDVLNNQILGSGISPTTDGIYYFSIWIDSSGSPIFGIVFSDLINVGNVSLPTLSIVPFNNQTNLGANLSNYTSVAFAEIIPSVPGLTLQMYGSATSTNTSPPSGSTWYSGDVNIPSNGVNSYSAFSPYDTPGTQYFWARLADYPTVVASFSLNVTDVLDALMLTNGAGSNQTLFVNNSYLNYWVYETPLNAPYSQISLSTGSWSIWFQFTNTIEIFGPYSTVNSNGSNSISGDDSGESTLNYAVNVQSDMIATAYFVPTSVSSVIVQPETGGIPISIFIDTTGTLQIFGSGNCPSNLVVGDTYYFSIWATSESNPSANFGIVFAAQSDSADADQSITITA